MCSIVGSFSKDKIIELCKLNEYRGAISHSISYYDTDEKDFALVQKSYGPINFDRITINAGQYCIVHQQAPTDNNNGIHPADHLDSYLWHNGLLKPSTITALQKIYKTDELWDTMLLLRFLQDHDAPRGVDGSFSCILWDGLGLYIFRNELAPMFFDLNGNISSTRFENSTSLEPNKFFTFDPRYLTDMKAILEFETVDNPYF